MQRTQIDELDRARRTWHVCTMRMRADARRARTSDQICAACKRAPSSSSNSTLLATSSVRPRVSALITCHVAAWEWPPSFNRLRCVRALAVTFFFHEDHARASTSVRASRGSCDLRARARASPRVMRASRASSRNRRRTRRGSAQLAAKFACCALSS